MEDRVFTVKDAEGNDISLKFKRPNQAILAKAELVSRTAFSKAFRQDIITSAEVDKLLRDRGLWDDEQQEKVHGLRKQVVELEEKLKDPGLSNDEGEHICAQLDILRLQIMAENSIHQSITDNTCETIASEEKNQCLAVECVVYADSGKRVYKSIEDFKARMDESMAALVFQETVIGALEAEWGRSLPTNLSDEYAENKWRAQRAKAKEKVEEKPKKKRAKKVEKAS